MSALFQDLDQGRLVRRITTVCAGDLTTAQAARLANGEEDLLHELSPASKQKVAALMTPAKRGELESIIGPTTDFVPIAYIQRAWVTSAAVARVRFGGAARGTGVMVSPRLLMTNNHVIDSMQQAANCSAQFNYQVGLDDQFARQTEFRLDPATFFWTSPVDVLDTTLIAVGERIVGGDPWSALVGPRCPRRSTSTPRVTS